MGKRIDLDAPSTNVVSHDSHPFYNDIYDEEDNYEELSPEEFADEAEEYNQENNISQEIDNQKNVAIDKAQNIATESAKKAASENAKKAVKKTVGEVVKKNPVVLKILIIVLPILFLIIIIVLSVIAGLLAIEISESGEGITVSGEYNVRCKNVTVIMTDKSQNYKKIGSKTYPIEDYIAGVVAAEVGGFNNIEVYKVIAIAARTYLLTHDNNKCIIESSDRKQVFSDVTNQRHSSNSLIYMAARETKGQVLLKGKKLASVEYDAFCSIGVDSNYYTLKQRNQKIPRSWADRQGGIADAWKQGNCAGNHGRGISQWGAYYLASQLNYSAEQILGYYLGDKKITLTVPDDSVNNNSTKIDKKE